MKWKLGLYRGCLCSILFGDAMVPNINIESDSILLLGYSILYKVHNLTRFNHKKHTTHFAGLYKEACSVLSTYLGSLICGNYYVIGCQSCGLFLSPAPNT